MHAARSTHIMAIANTRRYVAALPTSSGIKKIGKAPGGYSTCDAVDAVPASHSSAYRTYTSASSPVPHPKTESCIARMTDQIKMTRRTGWRFVGAYNTSRVAFMRTALLAAIITLGQLGLFIIAAPGRSIGERYLSAFQWDSLWYAHIARRGYVSTIPPVPDRALSHGPHS